MREDKIISALIGLIGACNSNPKTADTDALVIKALAFPLVFPEFDDRALEELVQEIYSEKFTIAPGCAQCTAPCGNTSDYDMSRIYQAEDNIRTIKLQILSQLQKIAFRAYSGAEAGIDPNFFYRALSYLNYDMEEKPLWELFAEAETINQSINKEGTEQ